MSRREAWLAALIIGAVLFLIGGCGYDFVYGSTETRAVVVAGKEYTPPWTETTTRYVAATDTRPSHVETGTTHHPAIYAIFTDDSIRISVAAAKYHSLEMGAEIRIVRKVGKWTGIAYPWSTE